MGFFDKLKGAIGIGQPKLEVSLSPNPVRQGSTVTVNIKLTGGSRALEVKEVMVRFFQKVKKANEQGTEFFDKQELADQNIDLKNYNLKPNAVWEGSVQFELPADIELTGSDHKYEIGVQVDVPGLDPRKLVDMTIVDENGLTAEGENPEAQAEEGEQEETEDTKEEKPSPVAPATPTAPAAATAPAEEAEEAEEVEEEEETEVSYSTQDRVGFLRDYMKRFDAMVEELKSHNRIQLVNYHRFPGLEDDEIADIETDAGFKLSEPIKAFYKQSNGLQLIWIDKEEEGYSPSEHTLSDNPKDWEHSQYDYWPYTGMVMIRPLEEVTGNLPYSLEYSDNEYKSEYRGREYGNADLEEKIRVFDPFNKYYDTGWIIREDGNHDVILASDHQACWTDSFLIDFDTYLEMVLAQKGLVSARKDFMYVYNGVGNGSEKTAYKPYWENRGLSLNNLFSADIFPGANEAPKSLPASESDLGIKMAKGSTIPQTEFIQISGSHRQWRNSGGYIRSWEILSVSDGLNMAVPRKVEGEKGEQADLNRKDLSTTRSKGVNLSHANLLNIYAPGQDFSNSNLSSACIVDSWLPMSNFEGANLVGVDFSRSNLKGANFTNAQIDQADFEGCDLTGAIFNGCNTTVARFNGARLNGVKQNIDSPENPYFRNDSLRLIQMLQKAGVDFILMEEPKKGGSLNLVVRPEEANVQNLIKIVNQYGETQGWYDHSDWVDTILNEEFESMGSGNIGFAKNKFEAAKNSAQEMEREGLTFLCHPDYWGLLKEE